MKPCIHFWFFFAWWTLGQFAKKWGTCRTCISTLRCPNWILKIQKNFKNFEKIFFAQIFIWYALECLKMTCDNIFLHVMVIHLIFGTLLIDDIAQNLWIRATYFCTSKAIQKAILMIMVLYWCVIYSKKRINRFSSNKQSFGFFTLQFWFLFCQKFFNSLVLLHCFCTDSTRKAFLFR